VRCQSKNLVSLSISICFLRAVEFSAITTNLRLAALVGMARKFRVLDRYGHL